MGRIVIDMDVGVMIGVVLCVLVLEVLVAYIISKIKKRRERQRAWADKADRFNATEEFPKEFLYDTFVVFTAEIKKLQEKKIGGMSVVELAAHNDKIKKMLGIRAIAYKPLGRKYYSWFLDQQRYPQDKGTL